jgi:N-carbamoylputrescine amidase
MLDTRIAIVVMNAPFGEVEKNLDAIEKWSTAAAAQGASIVCFPELTLTGYYARPEIRGVAIPADGPEVRRFTAVAEGLNLTILAGMAETDPATGRIYATHMAAGPEGVIGAYRKTHLGPPEQAVFSAGDSVPVFRTEEFSFGIQLCYDAHFPELSASMALDGAEVLFMPHASPGRSPDEKLASWMRHMPARAFDNGLYVIACNQCGKNGQGLSFPGVSVVIGPSGDVLASYAGMDAHMTLMDLFSDDLASVRGHRMRYFLPNRRPGLYLRR